MHLQYSLQVVTFLGHTMKIFDSPNCGKAVSDGRGQIERAKLPLWRRIQLALGFVDRIYAVRALISGACGGRT
jgi:hypothetical protein